MWLRECEYNHDLLRQWIHTADVRKKKTFRVPTYHLKPTHLLNICVRIRSVPTSTQTGQQRERDSTATELTVSWNIHARVNCGELTASSVAALPVYLHGRVHD